MKTILNRKRAISLSIAAFLLTAFTFAQGPEHRGCKSHMNIPDLTEEQKAKIDELTVPHIQAMNTYKAEIDKLEAELKLLEIAENPDTKKIESKIDEITSTQNKIAKERSKHRQSIRSLLNAEQKVFFDSNCCKGPEHRGNKHCGNEQQKNHCAGMNQNCMKHAESKN